MPADSLLDNPIVNARDLHFSFGERVIFNGLKLQIPRGKVTVIMGPSGCGKSTFLSLLGGRLRASSGELQFDNSDVPGSKDPAVYDMRRKMGMLFSKQCFAHRFGCLR